MRTIPLTKGRVALVDDEDYEALARFKWHAQARGPKVDLDGSIFYAMRRLGPAGHQRHIPMQVAILNPPDGAEIDHRNGDTLDNRRSNLRIATSILNRRNRKKSVLIKGHLPSSKYKGVSLTRYGTWRAGITAGAVRSRYLGSFKTEEAAAAAYDRASRELHGDFGRTNGCG